MFHKHHTSNERLQLFRDFRHQSPDANTVVEAFANVDTKSRYVDYYTPDTWPGLFDIIQQGMFCQSGITLIMAGILHHLGLTNNSNLKFVAISNHITGKDGLVLMDGGNCYNFLPGEVVSEQFAKENSIILDEHIIQPDKLFG